MMAEKTMSLKLTEAQRKRIAANREKAIELKRAKLAAQTSPKKQVQSVTQRSVDTGGGFLLDEEPLTTLTAPVLEEFPSTHSVCTECCKEFLQSFLLQHFDTFICDGCRDKEDKHKLITRTDAKSTYLLKDCDIDKREPPLKFIMKQNPHYSHGSMKLYLKCQVEERAVMVWGSLDALEEQLDKKEDDRAKRKQKAFNKRVKELRMTVRSSLFRPAGQNHVHSFGEEFYDQEGDVYYKMCSTCGHKMTYEKM
ncbi:DNA repair protein complementing XP-A cells homolog [Ornithodoros turicata]|uniref:DNA repair protein complementing XP-A cells homolog n=1 Tax=Ornithodoros turicata TaxID=34597 RepID=UPI003139AEBC